MEVLILEGMCTIGEYGQEEHSLTNTKMQLVDSIANLEHRLFLSGNLYSSSLIRPKESISPIKFYSIKNMAVSFVF